MSEQVTRRTFLKGATAAGVLLPAAAFAQAKKPAPAKKAAPAAEAIPHMPRERRRREAGRA